MQNTLYHHDSVKIKYDKDQSLLSLSWVDDAIDNVFMEVVQNMYKFTKELEIELWLIDASHAFGIKTWDNNWKCESVSFALEKTKLRKIARVVSHDIAYEAKINAFSGACKTDVKINFFSEEQAACNWLLKNDAVEK
jgi:hypothetical protein